MTVRFTIVFLLTAITVSAQSSGGAAPRTDLERRQQIEQLDKASRDLDNLQKLADNITAQRRFKCMSAFGSAAFCDCLNASLAIGLNFDGYIAATTNTKDEMGYPKLSADNKALVDSALNTRQQCVGKVFGFQK